MPLTLILFKGSCLYLWGESVHDLRLYEMIEVLTCKKKSGLSLKVCKPRKALHQE